MPPLEDWLRAVVETPGLTSLDLAAARGMLLEDALRVVPAAGGPRRPGGRRRLGERVARASRSLRLYPRSRSCCWRPQRAPLRRSSRSGRPANARVVCGRVEEQPVDWAGVALAKALAPPPVAAEWCLPLVREGGIVVLWVGESADLEDLARVCGRLAGELVESPAGLAVLRKTGPTPPGFPRRTGVARKRPL